MSNKTLSISAILTVSVLFGNTIFADDEHSERTLYRMQAKDAHLIRHVTGPVEESIRGVPAIPVDSFDWSGQNIIAIKGHAKLEIDPLSNTGKITAKWHDEYGHWTYRQNMFVRSNSKLSISDKRVNRDQGLCLIPI